jgi:hypothetical protein
MDSIIKIAPTPPQLISSLQTTDQELVEQPSCGTRRLATIQLGLGGPVHVVIDNGSGNVPTTGISSIPLWNKGELKIYQRMVETEQSMQRTDEIVSRPHLFRQHKVQGFNNEQQLQAQFHHKATDDFDSRQISLQQSYHIEGETDIQYTFFEAISILFENATMQGSRTLQYTFFEATSRSFENAIQGSSVEHTRGNHCHVSKPKRQNGRAPRY